MASLAAGRRGLATNSPPQFGHTPLSLLSTHEAQNVHSKEQMRAFGASGGRSQSQHSQFGRISSTSTSFNGSRSGRFHNEQRRSCRLHRGPSSYPLREIRTPPKQCRRYLTPAPHRARVDDCGASVVPPDYLVQRPAAGGSATGHAEAGWSTTMIGRGRAPYACPSAATQR